MDDDDTERSSGDSKGWLLGSQLRHRGSVHSDRWRGLAAELAEREYIAVYPVIGWWRMRPHLNRAERRARYALIVSITTPRIDADIYTPVLQQVQAGIATAVEV